MNILISLLALIAPRTAKVLRTRRAAQQSADRAIKAIFEVLKKNGRAGLPSPDDGTLTSVESGNLLSAYVASGDPRILDLIQLSRGVFMAARLLTAEKLPARSEASV